MRKLSLALNDVVSHHVESTRVENAEVCLAAFGLLTAYLDRVGSPERRRALAACFSDMLLAADHEPHRDCISANLRVRQRQRRKYRLAQI